MRKDFKIVPASIGAVIFLLAIVIFFLVITLISLTADDYEMFSFYGLLTVLVIVVVVGMLGLFAYQSRYAVFSLTDKGLEVGPGFYGRTVPWQKIDIGAVRVIDLNVEKEYQLNWRMNGAGLPGFSAGWFKLKNKEKALVFVTDRSRVVYVPTSDKYALLLSVREADEFVKAVKRWV